jgi:integrase
MTGMANRRRGSGEGSITELADGRWQARIDLGYVNGKRQRKAYFGKTRQEAARKLNGALAERERGLPIISERETVATFLTRWLAEVVEPSVRPKTYASYESLCRVHLIPALGRHRLSKLEPVDVQQFLTVMTNAGLSPRSVAYCRAVLRRALGQALKWGLLARNVATLVDPPRAHRTEIQPLTPAEVRVLLGGLHEDRLEALYTTAIALGLRQGELLGLRWQDIDFAARTLAVHQALQRVKGEFTFVEPKSSHSRRTLALPDFVVTALEQHRRRQLADRLRAGALWQDAGLVFMTMIGTPLDGNNVTHGFQRTLVRLGLRRQRFHDLRHCCASLLLAQGLALVDVKDTLGHSQISVTADFYGHLYPEQRREVARRMDALLGAQ